MLTTQTIDGMTTTREECLWAGKLISIVYRDRWFRVSVGQSDESADEYQPNWGYEVAEVVSGMTIPWDGSDYDYDSGTTALQAAQNAIRQTVDDDEGDRR